MPKRSDGSQDGPRHKRAKTEDAVESNGSENGNRDTFSKKHQPLTSVESSDDDFGPMPPPSGEVKKKKRRFLPHEKLYLQALPASDRYSKSLMHRETVTFVTMTPFTDFLITASSDGIVKFWKKQAVGIEFVKMFRAHASEILGVSVSADGRSYASIGADKAVKIFDVVTFGELLVHTHFLVADNNRFDRNVPPPAHPEICLLDPQAGFLAHSVSNIR